MREAASGGSAARLLSSPTSNSQPVNGSTPPPSIHTSQGVGATNHQLIDIAPRLRPFVEERVAHLDEPRLGVTIDGTVRQGLFELRPTGVSLEPLADAAPAFLAVLSGEQRARAHQPLESEDWRTWINVHMNFFRHGVMLEEIDADGRRLGLDLLRETLSARGFGQAREIMWLNQLIGDITGRPDEFGEWPYFVTVFAISTRPGSRGWVPPVRRGPSITECRAQSFSSSSITTTGTTTATETTATGTDPRP